MRECILRRGLSALEMLLDGHDYAVELGRDLWDFAVEIEALRSAGFGNNEFRWLVCRGLVDHAPETTLAGQQDRTFQTSPHGPGLKFSRRTCFVLTEPGIEFVREALAPYRHRQDAAAAPSGNGQATRRGLKPRWDRDRQELRLGDELVKQFKVPAANQERILAAFEEEGWPVCIDDPLPRHPEQDPKRRLHDTINSLNRNQKKFLIRFLGNGTGQGVRWQLVRPSENGNANGSSNGKSNGSPKRGHREEGRGKQ